MIKCKTNKFNYKRLVILICLGGFSLLSLFGILAQNSLVQTQNEIPFRVGERLTYNITFENFKNVAFAEIDVVSVGKLSGIDAVELSSKIKSFDLLSAAFYSFDETRRTFVSSETGLPIYIRKISKSNVLPTETIENYLKTPTSNYDLLSLIYKARSSGGIGTFILQENDKVYSFSLQTIGTEKFSNGVGEFETQVSSVQSQYLTDLGLTNFQINFSNDEQKIPVLIRFDTPKGKFRVEIASLQINNQNSNETPTPTPIPIPSKTPTPIPTPTPYIENQPLIERLPFNLGETLEFKVSNNEKDVATIMLQVQERKKFLGKDSLLLKAFIKNIEPNSQNIFNSTDTIVSQVDPISLMPIFTELKLSSDLAIFNQKAQYDQENGLVVVNDIERFEMPVGTHSVLSLAYAIRSFNLKPSRDPKNPVNDTRVSVFLGNESYVFTLRPSNAEIIDLEGNKVAAQLITIKSGNPSIDRLNIKLWLGTSKDRLPIRLTAGNYQADLVSSNRIFPKK